MEAGELSSILLNDFRAQWDDIRTDALAAFARVGESGWLVLGDEVKLFEAALSAWWGSGQVIGCGNGLDALELALRALGLKPGDKVLTTPLSAFATTLAIVRAGGVPVFVDVDATGLIDLEACSQLLARRSEIRFFVPVHLYGHALDCEALAALSQAPHLTLVEDCAQAIGARSHGKPVGSTGRAAATSFYPTKNLGCMGDGGAVLCADDALAQVVRSLRDYGQSSKYVHSRLGMNSRLDELQAAVLRTALLPRLKGFTERRRQIASTLREGIRNPALHLPLEPRGSESVWHLFPVLVEGDRARFKAHCDVERVGLGFHYPKLICDQEALAEVPFEVVGPLPRALRFATHEVSLPIHPYLGDREVSRIIDVCNSWQP